MTTQHPLTRAEIAALVGDVDDATMAAILAIEPSRAELDEALAWAAGEDDVMGEMERPLVGKAAQIYDLLTAEEEEEDERR